MARKRANGEGSYYQLQDRTWVYQVTVGRKEDGSPMRKPVSYTHLTLPTIYSV